MVRREGINCAHTHRRTCTGADSWHHSQGRFFRVLPHIHHRTFGYQDFPSDIQGTASNAPGKNIGKIYLRNRGESTLLRKELNKIRPICRLTFNTRYCGPKFSQDSLPNLKDGITVCLRKSYKLKRKGFRHLETQ